jgi:argininosuccinate lyase
MTKIWDKGFKIDKEIEKFTVGNDYILDQNLVFWDCISSIAQAKMLHKIGIINLVELKDAIKGLKEIIELDKKGKFKILQKQEDCHTAIESYLTKNYGDVGKKIHTARSRNDQILTDMKLYIKKQIIEIEELVIEFSKTLVNFAKKNPIAMPGFTHMQMAMPSTVAMWSSSFSESMLSNIQILNNTYETIDSSPLGSAAGYGASIDIDRQYTSDLLGFSKLQNNVVFVQNSRGKNEALVLSSLMNIMLDLNKISTDLMIFSMPQFGFFYLPKEFTTGSSIMPQKKNPDVLELIRGKSNIMQGLHNQLVNVIQNLPSGYNRDFQLIKEPLMKGIEITKTSLKIIDSVFKNLKVNKINCEKTMSNELFATDIAYDYVKQGMPFRDAYKKVANEIDEIAIDDIYKYINNKKHLGAPGNLRLNELEKEIDVNKKIIEKKAIYFENKILELLKD